MEEDVKEALRVLRSGGVILYPTDTVWGIGCDATNGEAVRRIFEIKKRDDAKSMLVLVDSMAMLERWVPDAPDVALQLAEAAVEPLTIIYDSAPALPAALKAPDGSVGIRVCADKFCQALCRGLRRPVVSTSANISGRPAPAIFSEIDDEVKEKVDYVVRFRQDDLTKAKPSGIIKVSEGGRFKIIR